MTETTSFGFEGRHMTTLHQSIKVLVDQRAFSASLVRETNLCGVQCIEKESGPRQERSIKICNVACHTWVSGVQAY